VTAFLLLALILLALTAYWWGDAHPDPYLEDQPTYLTVIPSHVNRSKS